MSENITKIKTATTLLDEFLSNKIERYKEPQRKGTPKGELIGFSKAKYSVILYSLTSMKLADLSKKTGVSYGVLRKWRTEKPFKDEVKKIEREYAKHFYNYLWGREACIDEGMSFTRPKKNPTPVSPDYKLGRSRDYSLELCAEIENYIISFKMPVDRAGTSSLRKFLCAIKALYFLYPKEGGEELESKIKRGGEPFILWFLEDIKKFIQYKNPSEEEREMALMHIEQILNYYNSGLLRYTPAGVKHQKRKK